MSSEKVAEDIGNCVRNNISWQNLPVHLKQVLQNNQRDYEKYVFNYSLKNQLRFRGNLAHKVFRHEQRYYELLVQKSINCLCLFPYHLADIVTKGLRVTPFNYYLDVISNLLRSDKSYDTLPNFTAADCLRVLGIGRNEYLSLISDLKTHTSKSLLFSSKPNPLNFLPRFPVRIHIEPWWRVEVGYVLEQDIRFVSAAERSLIDDLIDFGSQTAGICDYQLVQSLYRKGLIYLDVPISGEDRICIPPLRNFVMNRVSGDYFENLLYKIFVSADEHMSIAELAQMLQLELDTVKQAVSLFCRLGFAKRKSSPLDSPIATQNFHESWAAYSANNTDDIKPPITPLNYNSVIIAEQPLVVPAHSSPRALAAGDKDNNSAGYNSSDNHSDFSFANLPQPSPVPLNRTDTANSDEPELSSEQDDLSDNITKLSTPEKSGKRVGFLFDSTLTAFLMMGNLSPGLKNHAVTMFEVGKLCEESMDTFLRELEKVSLLDAEGEGDVSRYFAHAVILRSTICSLRHLLPGGLDLLRLECLESLDYKTRDRVLEKKYKFIISATPLTANLTQPFSIPFFGQFYRSSECAHMWTKLFYNHITGYGPPGLLLCKGTVLKTLPRLFLGYGKLLVNILHSDSYVLNSENFRNLNDQLKNGCILIQGYGIRTPGVVRIEAFPFDAADRSQQQLMAHKALQRLKEYVDLERTCGYISFVNTGVPDIGCENYELDVCLKHPKNKAKKFVNEAAAESMSLEAADKIPPTAAAAESDNAAATPLDILSPTDYSELTSFARLTPTAIESAAESLPLEAADNMEPDNAASTPLDILSPTDNSELTSFARLTPTAIGALKSPDENYFAVSPQSSSPSNVFISDDCNELLASELAKCQQSTTNRAELVSQGSVEIPLNNTTVSNLAAAAQQASVCSNSEDWTLLDVNFGVPLFDVDCNTRICQQLVKRLCCDEANLQQLPAINVAMNEIFMRFIKQCLFFEDEQSDELNVGKHLPQPRINLAFENGRVCYWSGR